jgi:hypothetical protein
MPYGEIAVEAQTALEFALAKAADDPASRPEFYKTLLESDVFIIGHSDAPEADGESTIPAGAKLSIVNWEKADGTPVIPFFGSLEALQRALKEEARYVQMPARSLFEVTMGATLVLNPASPYSKEFFPNEISALLETGLNHVAKTRTVQKATRVLLGQPSNYPSEMVSALTKLLAKHPAIVAAHLCLMHDPTASEKPALVVGFVADGNAEQAMREAGSVAADTAPKGELVDFVLLKSGEQGISQYMLSEVKPFYERSWGVKLRSMFSPARA